MGEQARIIVYPVGLLADIKHRRIRRGLRSIRRYIAARNWRALRNSFNGYLAEPECTGLPWTRCGTGWTKRRAASRLGVHLLRLSGDSEKQQ